MRPLRRSLLLAVGICLVAGALAIPVASARRASGVRLWHGLPIVSLDAASLEPASASSSSSTVPGQTPPPRGVQQVLSNERTVTVFARTAHNLPIYTSPSSSSRRITALHRLTEDGFPEVYLLLAQFTDSKGQTWVELRIPGRPNGRVGWVMRQGLSTFGVNHDLLVIDRHKLRITFYVNGKSRFSAPVGIGKPSTPTPAGHFWIRERFKILDRKSGYWPYAMGSADYSVLSDWPGGGVVGIHGDFHTPQLIPGHPSHGCVRMHDPDIGWLAPRVTPGTPLYITP